MGARVKLYDLQLPFDGQTKHPLHMGTEIQ